MQAKVEDLTVQAGLQIRRAILENEVTHRVGPRIGPILPPAVCAGGKQPGYVVFAGQKIPLERPRVRTREGQEVELESYGQLQQDENCNERCGNARRRGCPRGTIGEQ
jgi:putative transposase